MAANGGQCLSGFAWTMLFLNNIFEKKEQKQLFQFAQGTLSPPQRATGACRPWGGRQGPVARWGGDRPPSFFFLQRLRCKIEEKKLHSGPVAL